MLKGQNINYMKSSALLKRFLFFSLSLLLLFFLHFGKQGNQKYSFFIEFNDANGIVIGTPIRIRGITIGTIQNIQLKLNSILVLATINSRNIIIARDSIIETTQTGLLNESVVDIIPVKSIDGYTVNDPLSISCNSSTIICNNMYMLGDRGLNYDDLIRSTTRISQRFDDPSFFYLFYTLLQQSIELTDFLFVFTRTFFNLHGKEFSKIVRSDFS